MGIMDSDPLADFSGLVKFSRARIEEDEAAARESYYEGQRWLAEEEGVYRWPDDELVHSADRKADARHIARWGPARVLLCEVPAKRALLDAYESRVRRVGPGLSRELLRLVAYQATAWNDHPDYLAEWVP